MAMVLLLGVCVLLGVAILAADDLEMRWVVFPAAFLVVGTAFAMVGNKEQLLWDLLVFSFQADVSIRFFYGKAGSGGLIFPMSFLLGLALVSWYGMGGGLARIDSVRWTGRLGPPILLLLGTSVLSVLLTTERFIGVTALFTQMQLMFIYVLAFNVVTTEERLERTVNVLFTMLLVQSLVYFLQYSLGITFTLSGEVIPEGEIVRPGGTVSTNPSGFGSFVVPILSLAVARFLVGYDRFPRRLLEMLILGAMGAIVLTLTRAVWVGTTASIVMMTVVAYRRGLLRYSRFSRVAAGGVVVAILGAPFIAQRLAESTVESAYDERAGLMRMAIRVIEHNPIVGVGLGAYAHTYKTFLTPELMDQWVYTVHNAYLLRAAETGIPGGIGLVLLFVFALRQALRLSRHPHLMAKTLGVGWCGAFLALAWEQYWDIWSGWSYNALFWFTLGTMDAVESRIAPRLRAQMSSPARGRGAAVPALPARRHAAAGA